MLIAGQQQATRDWWQERRHRYELYDKVMKHEILEDVWRVRDQISAECGHDLKKLAAMLRHEEFKCAHRLARLPIRRRPVRSGGQAFADRQVQFPAGGVPSKPAIALSEEPPPYGRKAGGPQR